jgi:hypothetical protein
MANPIFKASRRHRFKGCLAPFRDRVLQRTPRPRSGAPQSWHTRGLRALEFLFPGIVRDLHEAGVVRVRVRRDMRRRGSILANNPTSASIIFGPCGPESSTCSH